MGRGKWLNDNPGVVQGVEVIENWLLYYRSGSLNITGKYYGTLMLVCETLQPLSMCLMQ